MTAAFQPRTTGPADLSGRRFASPSRAWRRAPRRRNARPAKRVAGQKTASRNFFRAPSKPRRENRSQVTGTHLESRSYRYVFAPGCAVAPNSAATTSTTGKDIKIYVFTDTNKGNDYNSRVLSLSVGVSSAWDKENKYTVIPIGKLDAPPTAGPNTYVVTHGYAELTSPLGFFLGAFGVGIKYDGNVLVPIRMNVREEMPGAQLEQLYGQNNVFYCGQNGQTAFPWTIASRIVNQNMSERDRQAQAASLQAAFATPIN